MFENAKRAAVRVGGASRWRPPPCRRRRQARIDTGDTAWLLIATALVLMMNIPGLALFYAGMVRKKNVLATAVQAFAIAALVTVLWFAVGYSLAFTDGGALNGAIGALSRAFGSGLQGSVSSARQDSAGERLPDVPGDVRHHHAGHDCRRLRRAHEVLGHDVVHGAVAAAASTCRWRTGCGAAASSARQACLISPAGWWSI